VSPKKTPAEKIISQAISMMRPTLKYDPANPPDLGVNGRGRWSVGTIY